MHSTDENLEIVSEIAKEIASENNSPKQENLNETNTNKQAALSDTDVTTEKSSNKTTRKTRNKNKPTAKDLAIQKQAQNLAERKVLLIILAILFGLQLLFMNAIVLFIVLWSIFDWECFRNIDGSILKSILDFSKYYVTAVLVELLGGIMYIVHRVFTSR